MTDRTHTVTAVLPCIHLPATRAFYERLGFHQTDGDDIYAMLQDDQGAEIHLQPASDGWVVRGRNPFGIYIYTESVDALAERFTGTILGRSGKPEDKPWGMYEFALSDPDGALVRIGWPTRLRAKPSAD